MARHGRQFPIRPITRTVIQFDPPVVSSKPYYYSIWRRLAMMILATIGSLFG